MSKTNTNRDQQLLLNARQKLKEELSDLDIQLKEQKRKEQKFKKFLKEKAKEIQDTTKKIKKMSGDESQSKNKIDVNIDLLKSLIDSIDKNVSELKEKMVQNSEKAIEENISDFENYVNDLQDIMAPLGESKSIKNQLQLSQTVIGIAMTLEMLSENIEDSIESMSELIQKANADALQKSSKDFDDFLLSIQKIFNTFNNILQKLKLVNSIKKYLDLEEIYSESNQILDTLEEIQKKQTNILINKELRKEELEYLEKFGMSKNLTDLNARKDLLKKKFDEIQSEYNNFNVKHAKLCENYEFTVQEKETIRDWFEALTEEVISQQNIATDTYNEMFATLDSIDSTINFIKADIRNASEREINLIINEFTTYANTFGKMVGIIKKIEKTTLSNMQKGIKVINGKSKIYIEKISKIVKKLSKQVKNSNIKAIDESFGEFDSFIDNFKEKFHIIQDAVSAITLTSSSSLIGELLNLSDDQIKGRQNLLKSELELLSLNTKLDFIKKQIQGVENELKLYSDKGKTDLKRRKVLKIRKSISEGEELLSQKVNWNITNSGIVSFEDFTISDLIPRNLIESDSSQEFNKIETNNQATILEWNIKKLNKQDTTEIQYNVNGFSVERKKTTIPFKNISSSKSFRYRNIAKPVSLEIIERDGEGAIVLTNLSEQNRIWSISLQFEKTSSIINIPNSLIKGLKPQESFIKKYFYKKAGALKPINFICESKYEIGLNLERSKEKINEYLCEVFFENTSDFLIHLNSIELYRPNKSMKSAFKTDELSEKLRPKMDYRHKFILNSRFDPPRLMIIANFTLQLVFEYDRGSRINLDNLQETRELELDGKTAQSIKIVSYKPKKIPIHPEIQKIDSDIDSIRDKIKDFESKLKDLRYQISTKQESRRKVLKKIEKEKVTKKTTRKKSSKSTKQSKKTKKKSKK